MLRVDAKDSARKVLAWGDLCGSNIFSGLARPRGGAGGGFSLGYTRNSPFHFERLAPSSYSKSMVHAKDSTGKVLALRGCAGKIFARALGGGGGGGGWARANIFPAQPDRKGTRLK